LARACAVERDHCSQPHLPIGWTILGAHPTPKECTKDLAAYARGVVALQGQPTAWSARCRPIRSRQRKAAKYAGRDQAMGLLAIIEAITTIAMVANDQRRLEALGEEQP
jgi:hypothetical protein